MYKSDRGDNGAIWRTCMSKTDPSPRAAAIQRPLVDHPAIEGVVLVGGSSDDEFAGAIAFVLLTASPAPSSDELRALIAPLVPSETADALRIVPFGPRFAATCRAQLSSRRRHDDLIVKIVTAICADVLKLDDVAPEDNFLDLGGQSLAAARLLARLDEVFQISVPLGRLFESATLFDFAATIAAAESKPGAVARIAEALRLLVEQPSRSERQGNIL